MSEKLGFFFRGMADHGTTVLDISSDEDVGWGDSMAKDCGGDDSGGCRDDGDWISELLDKVDKETDDSDEVEVVREVIAKPKLRVTKSLVKRVNKIDDDDDDECVILDGDPDKPVAIENDKGEDDSDELFVVSVKGQVLLLFSLLSL